METYRETWFTDFTRDGHTHLMASDDKVLTVFHGHFPKSKLYSKWIPLTLLTFDKKQQHVSSDEIKSNFYVFCENELVTALYDQIGSIPKLLKTQKSAGKVMVPIFWHKHGIITIDCLKTR